MHRSILIRAAVVSVLVASLFQVGTTIIFGGGVEYSPPVDFDWLDALSREQRNAWLAEHGKPYNGFESLIKQFSNIDLAIEYLKSLLVLFVLLYVTSVVASYWVWKTADSNNDA